MRQFKIYLAGPDVFLPNAKEIGAWLVEKLAEYDMLGLYPLDNEIKLDSNPFENGKAIARANMGMIEQCDGILANLQPFRGPSADTGTVWECAYGKGLGRVVVGYNIDVAAYKNKVIDKVPHDGMMIEDFGTWDNIMLVHGINSWEHNFLNAIPIIKRLLIRKLA
jgi:nucleoside 2-deoxyribosyltransferase